MKRTWTIGSAADCDLVLDLPIVSGYHCRVKCDEMGYSLVDLGSSNGTYVNGIRVDREQRITRNDSITLGLTTPMPWPSEALPHPALILRIGREPDNDFVVDQPTVSGHHARIIWNGDPDEVWIEDLRSSNGTALGSPERKITRSLLKAVDTVFLGSHRVPASDMLCSLDPSFALLLTFQGNELVIGRDMDCDRRFDLPTLSGRHARLKLVDGEPRLEDLGSANGTFINGRRIAGLVPVRSGDLINLGGATIRLAVDVRLPLYREGVAAQTPQERPIISSIAPDISSANRGGLSDNAIGSPLGRSRRILILLAQSLLVALVIVILAGKPAWPSTPEQWGTTSHGIASIVSLLGLASIWFGLSATLFLGVIEGNGSLGVTKKHGLDRLFYRCGMLGGVAACQCVLLWGIVSRQCGLESGMLPASGILILTSLAGISLGFLFIATLPRTKIAWAILPLALIAMWILGGQILPLPRMPYWLQTAANASPTRWAFEGLLVLEAERRPSGEAGDLAENYFPADTVRIGPRGSALALLFFQVGVFACTVFLAFDSSRGRHDREPL
jgi:pSer/pThr/pTyr-binding forkhead associated (FHA) protein